MGTFIEGTLFALLRDLFPCRDISLETPQAIPEYCFCEPQVATRSQAPQGPVATSMTLET
jgi:hypothetical protein